MNVILLGEAGTGKSSFVNVLKGGGITNVPTIGMDFQPFQRYRIWDTAGQERFKAIGRGYYRQADVAPIFFSANDPKSYEGAIEWENDFKQHSERPTILVANKADLGKADEGVHISCKNKHIQPVLDKLEKIETKKKSPQIVRRKCSCY